MHSPTKVHNRARARRVIVRQAIEDTDLAINVFLARSRCREAQRHGIGREVFA
jgi:hypothetical protein